MMKKREIQNLELKIKYTKEYLNNGGYEKINFINILNGLMEVKVDVNGNVDPDTVNPTVNAFMLSILAEHYQSPIYSEKYSSEYISTLQKSLYFEQENIDTEEQFDRIYDEYKARTDTLFRGQREAKWRLYSKIQRFWISDGFGEKYQFLNFLENLVAIGLEHFAEKIRASMKEVHEDTENDIAVLGFLQHHGCPTPLLDWTFKFQNALYFAIDGLQPKQHQTEIEDYCSVYFLEEKFFEGAGLRQIMLEGLARASEIELERLISEIGGDDEQRKSAMREKFKGRSVFDKNKFAGSGMIKHMTALKHVVSFPISYFSDRDVESGIVFSLNNSENIQNQQGVFTWNAHPTKPLEMVGNEEYSVNKKEEEKGDYRFCHCYNINKKLEKYIRKRLDKEGITKEFIYPNLELDTTNVFKLCKSL